jgi:replicative DNA helicase
MLQDLEVWSAMRKDYLPPEYHKLFAVVTKYCEEFHSLPTFEDLHLYIRDEPTLEKLYAVEFTENEADPETLLEFLKNQYTQSEILNEVETWIDDSIAFESAEESVEHLQQIVLDIENRVELIKPEENLQRLTLFESDQELSKYLSLGLNREFDYNIQFSPRDYLLVGGRRGIGKSITCANVANNVYEEAKKTAIVFSIEMDIRSNLQRICSISTDIPFARLRNKNLSVEEWGKVALWWSRRFIDGESKYADYLAHRSFEKLHKQLSMDDQLHPDRQLDIIYDPGLTVARIRAELDKRIKNDANVGIVIVDYINQVKRANARRNAGQYDWAEQIEISKALKGMAQEYEVPVFSPYQTDATGEARFAKGILDSADAAWTLEAWDQEDACMTFKCVKMRSAAQTDFTSTINWETLKIGPDSASIPTEREEGEDGQEDIHDLKL